MLYRVRWKNYCSDDDTWEPEAHLEDCREVLLSFKKNMAEVKSKKEAEPKKTVVSLSDSQVYIIIVILYSKTIILVYWVLFFYNINTVSVLCKDGFCIQITEVVK